MVTAIRKKYNGEFTEEKFINYLNELKSVHPGTIEFPVAETPVFIDKVFKEKILSACESIIDVITQTNFSAISKNAVPKQFAVANENTFSHFIAFDFGICENEQKEPEPQLIEMQGFPSLFAYEVLQDEIVRKRFYIPENYSAYLNGFDKTSYLQLLKDIIVGDEKEEQVILLELFPHQQKQELIFIVPKII